MDWFTRIEVSSLALVETYVARGYGIGLAVAPPRGKFAANLRVVPLPDFAPVTLGAAWMGKPTPLLQACLKEMQRHVDLLNRPA